MKSGDRMPVESVSEEEASDRNMIEGHVHPRGGITLGHIAEHTATMSSGYWLFAVFLWALGERKLQGEGSIALLTDS